MGFDLFGKREKQPVATREDLVRNAVRFIVSNGFYLSGGTLFRISSSHSYAKLNSEQRIGTAVASTVESFRGEDLSYVNRKMEEVKDQLLTDSLVASISEELIEDAVDAARGRALVKGLRAGLDHSEAFLKIMEAESVKEVEVIEAWIERSNAYKAVTDG
jgi:hypothetical protein